MKAKKFHKRERRTAGRATGRLLCRFSFPLNGDPFTVHPLSVGRENAINNARKYVDHHLSNHNLLLDGASFSLIAEIRVRSGRLGRKVIAKWKAGDEISAVFATAHIRWNELQFEDDRTEYEVDIDLGS